MLYQNGLCNGTFDYYNHDIQKYWVSYSDRSDDYIGLDPVGFTCSKLTTETLEQGVKYVKS